MDRIDPAKVIQQRLAAGLGLDKYAFIEQTFRKIDVSQDEDFQRIFNGFYTVRRNAEWRNAYYRLFEEMKQVDSADFDTILDEMYRQTGNVEASFSSKMLATLRPEMPIWDKYVVQNLGLKVPTQNDPMRLRKTKELYAGIVCLPQQMDCLIQRNALDWQGAKGLVADSNTGRTQGYSFHNFSSPLRDSCHCWNASAATANSSSSTISSTAH